MALPPQRTVTGTYVNPVTGKPYDGTNDRGNYLIFEPHPPTWTDREGNQILLGSGRVNLDENGSFEKALVCTDGTDVLPSGRLWRIVQHVGHASTADYFAIPEGSGSLDISDLLAVDVGGVLYVPVPGPPGPQGPPGQAGGESGADGKSAYEIAVEEGFVGTVDEWLASLVGAPGAPGAPGADGQDGVNGTNGIDGQDGAPGAPGAPGAQGIQGIQGEPGEPGAQGIQGEPGPQPPLGNAGDGPTVALKSDDPTTTDSRTPTAHAASHASAGSDALTPEAIGAYAATAGSALDDRVTVVETGKLAKASNLADLTNPATARDSLGLGDAAVLDVGNTAGTVAAGNDARITGALPASGGSISGSLAVAGNALGQSFPAAHGITAWAYDPALAVNSTELSNGVLYLVRLNIAASASVTKVYWWVGNSGSGAVAGQNLIGLYSSTGTLLASTNVDSSIGSAGLKTTTISSQSLTAGSFCWVGLLFNASVPPTLTRGSGWTGVDAAANLGLSASAYRFARNGSGRTALPSPLVPASNTGTDFAGPWAAVGP